VCACCSSGEWGHAQLIVLGRPGRARGGRYTGHRQGGLLSVVTSFAGLARRFERRDLRRVGQPGEVNLRGCRMSTWVARRPPDVPVLLVGDSTPAGCSLPGRDAGSAEPGDQEPSPGSWSTSSGATAPFSSPGWRCCRSLTGRPPWECCPSRRHRLEPDSVDRALLLVGGPPW